MVNSDGCNYIYIILIYYNICLIINILYIIFRKIKFINLYIYIGFIFIINIIVIIISMKKNTKHKKISLRLKKENDNNYRPVSPIVERVFTDNEEKIEEYKNLKKQHIPSSNKSHPISSNNNSNDTNSLKCRKETKNRQGK